MEADSQKPIHIWVPGIRDDTGGIQAFSRFFVRALREGFPNRPIRVFIKNEQLDAADPLRSIGISTHSLASVPGHLRSAAMASLGIWHGLRERPICTLSTHLHFFTAMKALRTISGIPYGGVLHGIEAWKIRSAARIEALKSANCLMAVSSFTRDRVIAEYGVDPALTSVVPNTFDLERFTPGPKPAHLLERYGLKPGQPVLLTVSRLALSERYKGHWQVLIALQTIRRSIPDIRYVIVGTGDELQHINVAVRSMGLAENVIFAGFVPNHELADHYRLCDVFVMPSTKEGFGIVFLEAAACGKPVIGGRLDGSVDALDHGRLGILVDPHSPGEIADAITTAVRKTHPNSLLFSPEALSRAVSDAFGYEAVKARLLEQVTRLIEHSGRSREHAKPRQSPEEATASSIVPLSHAPRIVVLTQLNSPYQVEFFNTVALHGGCHLEVIYLTHQDRNRKWVAPDICHSHIILSENPELRANAMEALLGADLAVFNYYTDIFAWQAIRQRAQLHKPWVFWGERPGFFHLGPPGGWFRQFALAPLHRSTAPIWGVGQFGIDGYRREFGDQHSYGNLPYFSNLTRFELDRGSLPPRPRTILYSGVLVRRKGVDLLARAFASLSSRHHDVRLLIVGEGELRPEMEKILSVCRDRVEWAGFQSWESLPGFYARADVFCFPSRYDGWGLALVEALAAGLPCIGTDQTGSALEFLTPENKNGWLVKADSLSAFEAALEKAITLPTVELRVMQEKARQSVQAHTLLDGARRFVQMAGDALREWGRPAGNHSSPLNR